MTPNFIDKADGCVCDKKQTNENWIAMNCELMEEMIGLNMGQQAEIGSCSFLFFYFYKGRIWMECSTKVSTGPVMT